MKEYNTRPKNTEVNKFLVDTYTKMGNMAKADMFKVNTTIEKI